MDIFFAIVVFIAGMACGSLANHWLRNNKPEEYDDLADRAKRAGDSF